MSVQPAAAPAEVRTARSIEFTAIAELTLESYRPFTDPAGGYLEELADVAGRAAATDLLVAVAGGEVLGSVALVTAGGPYAEHAGPGEAMFRMLAVRPTARGRGVATALVRACLERAVAAGCQTMALFTQVQMTAAHRLYLQMGFARVPAKDWEVHPGLLLWRFERSLADLPRWCPHCGRPRQLGEAHPGCDRAAEWEPPRYCRACGRRQVIQVIPTGWRSTCSHHGLSDDRAQSR